jgi:TolA-binding protein
MRRAGIVSLLTAALSVGCITTKEEGLQLRSDVEIVREQVAAVKRDQDAARARMEEKLATISGRVRELEGTLRSLRQADADSGVQMEKVIAEVQILRGELEEARFQLGETKKSVADIMARPPVEVAAAAEAPKVDAPAVTEVDGKPVPAEAKAHLTFAQALYKEGKHSAALQAVDLFLAKHKSDKKLVDKANYLRAETLFQAAELAKDAKLKERAYRQAILAYQKVLESKTSKDVASAMFKIGLAFERLGYADNAIVFYETLIKEHGKSAMVKEAKKRVRALKKKTKRKKKRR